MAKTINLALLVLILVIALGFPYTAMSQRCSGTYDCRVTGCPCMNGVCTCSYPRPALDIEVPPKPPSALDSKLSPKLPSGIPAPPEPSSAIDSKVSPKPPSALDPKVSPKPPSAIDSTVPPKPRSANRKVQSLRLP